MPDRPEVVCLCGSLRFETEVATAQRELTLAGAIVLAPVALDPVVELTDDQRAALGELHLRRIDLADRVLVVNPGGYIGESVAREIAYAAKAGKPVSYTGTTERAGNSPFTDMVLRVVAKLGDRFGGGEPSRSCTPEPTTTL